MNRHSSTSGLYPGLTENEIAEVLDNTLRAAGMEPFFDIVLFGGLSCYFIRSLFSNHSAFQMRMHLTRMEARMGPRFLKARPLSSLMLGK